MPHDPVQVRLRREQLETAKRQSIVLVSSLATMFVLWPQRFQIIRNLFFVPILACLTAVMFDLIASLGNTWDNLPFLLKCCIPVDMNFQIAAPFDLVSKTVSRSFTTASLQLDKLVMEAKYNVEEFKKAIIVVLINWLLSLLGQGSLRHDPQKAHNARYTLPPTPEVEKWYGVLVATPPIHDYGSFGEESRPFSGMIAWKSFNPSSIPSISYMSTFRVHISFCLVPKATWECPKSTLQDKFKAGLYWEKLEVCDKDGGVHWTEAQVRNIKGIEVLGSIQGAPNPVDACHQYFASLRQDWEYLKISWNDVDFAIILGFLVTGPQAATRSNKLFLHFCKLRIEKALVPRNNAPAAGFLRCWCVGVAAAGLTFVTGGLAAPIMGPVMGASCFAGLGCAGVGAAMSSRDAAMWQKRLAKCRNLLNQFPQLEALFDT